MPGQLVKAYIFDEDKGQKVVDCLFNPNEYSFAQTNQWSETQGKGNVPLLNFSGAGGMTLTLSLLFDTYTMEGQPDVRDYTDKVVKLMQIDPSLQDSQSKRGRPPRVSFRWGKSHFFKSVITNLTQKFTLFLSDGRPVRATLTVTFRQSEDPGSYPAQNPTSVAEAPRVHLVQPGETIDSIAFTEYGDAAQWRTIADYNEIDDPLRLRPGQRLALPPV